MVLKCDKKAKEERIQCVIENRLENISVVGNVVMTCRNEILDKTVTKLIKIKDSDDHFEENMQHKYGEKWDLIQIEARHLFSSSTTSMIMCVAGTHYYL